MYYHVHIFICAISNYVLVDINYFNFKNRSAQTLNGTWYNNFTGLFSFNKVKSMKISHYSYMENSGANELEIFIMHYWNEN